MRLFMANGRTVCDHTALVGGARSGNPGATGYELPFSMEHLRVKRYEYNDSFNDRVELTYEWAFAHDCQDGYVSARDITPNGRMYGLHNHLWEVTSCMRHQCNDR